jgi:hypothetical protein
MKKIILFISLLIFTACSKDSDNTPSNNNGTQQNTPATLSGTWKGEVTSAMCSSTTGCIIGYISNYCSITFYQNGNTVTVNGLIPQVTGSTPLTATLNNNIITIPFNALSTLNWDFIEGRITISGNSASVTATTQSFDAQNNMTPCCTYHFSGTITKQ